MATIKAMDSGSYKFTVSLGRNVSGKQIRRVMTWQPEKDKHYTPRQLEKEVQRQATLFEEACKSGQVTKGGNMRLVDFIPEYYAIIKSSVAPTTMKKYQYIIENMIVPALGHFKLKDIKPIHIQRFVNELTDCNVIVQKSKDGTVKTDAERKRSPATVQRYYTCLRSIMHNAYSLELIPSNPCDKGKIKLPSIGEQTTEIYNKEELAELLEALKCEPLQFRVLIHLAMITGCRRGELVALEWSDIDFEKRTIAVHKSAYKIKGEPTKIKDTKSHKSRKVKVPQYMADMLLQLKDEHIKRRMRLGTAWQGADWVFIQDNGDIMFPTSPTQMFDKFLKRKGLPHRKFHSLRHTSATLSLMSGVDIKTVGERLGHSQMKTTNRYVHALEEADERAADVLGELVRELENRSADDKRKDV